MKKLLILLALGAILVTVLVFSGSFVTAAIPHLINYQGMLTDEEGEPLDGIADITFEIWNAPSGGIKRWWQTQYNVPVDSGLFNVILGELNPIDLSFYEDANYWLQIIVEQDTMPSRLKFTSVAFAYRAQKADTATYAVQVGNYPHDHDDAYVNVLGPDSIRTTDAAVTAFHVKTYGSSDADGIRIYTQGSTADGIYIDSAGDCGIEMWDIGTDGIQIYDVADDGIYMDDIEDDGIYMADIAGDGIWLNDIEGVGIYVHDAAASGLYIEKASYGIWIDSTSAGCDGIVVDYGEDDGVQVTHADDDGIYVDDAGGDGLYVYHADRFGLYIYDSDSNGIHVASADGDGIEAHGGQRGGDFQSGFSGYAGVAARSYNNSSGSLGLAVYGYATATGGFSKSVPGPSGDVPAFTICSPDVELIVSGSGTLVRGRAEIAFEQTFQEAISPEIPVKVVLTAQGAPSGLLYVTAKSNRGFSVERLEIPDLAIKSDDITFDWIAIARQKGYEQRPEVVMEEEGSVADEISREEALRAEELKHQEELERDARYRQEMLEKQTRKEAEREQSEREEQEEGEVE